MYALKTPALIAALLTVLLAVPAASAQVNVGLSGAIAVDPNDPLADVYAAKATAMGLVDEAEAQLDAKLEASTAAAQAEVAASAEEATGIADKAHAAFEAAVDGIKGFASGLVARMSFDLSFG